VIKTVNVNVNF